MYLEGKQILDGSQRQASEAPSQTLAQEKGEGGASKTAGCYSWMHKIHLCKGTARKNHSLTHTMASVSLIPPEDRHRVRARGCRVFQLRLSDCSLGDGS